MNQYFTLFQLEPQFDLDLNTLEQTYRRLAARFHPDKFAAASAFEQKQAMMMASQRSLPDIKIATKPRRLFAEKSRRGCRCT